MHSTSKMISRQLWVQSLGSLHSTTLVPVAPLGSIPAILSCPQDSQYPWSQRVSFAKDIASGMVSDQPLTQVAQSAMRSV